MWFSKCFKLSKRQYEEARKEDKEESKWIIHPEEEWKRITSRLEEIRTEYRMNEVLERLNLYWPTDLFLSSGISNKDETWYYLRVKDIINYVGDGWCHDFKKVEYVYHTSDSIISSYEDGYRFEKLENGDLLVKKTIKIKSSKNKDIEELRVKRYDCGEWSVRTITTTYSKKLLSDAEIQEVNQANLRFCIPYEAMYQMRELEFK